MAKVSVELNFDNLLAAILRLPREYKLRIWQPLDAELHRDEIERDFRRALYEVWNAYKDVPEEEVNADIERALGEVRAANAARRP